MKVLHLLNSNRFSGAENVVCQIIKAFRNEQNIKMVYCSPDGQIREALQERSIEFEPVSKLSVAEVERIIKQQQPDVIHAHDMRASFFAARACGSLPLVSHIHNNAFDARRISAKSVGYCYAAIKAKHIFWVSQSAFEGYAFHKCFKNKSSVLRNIIDVEALYKRTNCDFYEYDYDVVYLGRLTYPKHPQRLMNVMRLVREKMPNIKMAVIGTGELEEEAKRLARDYNLLDNVFFLGFQSNPLKMLHDSKVMIMTSRWEGTPMCALEAMALGVPIVGTPVDGLKAIIKDGETGYLSNDDAELAEKVCAVLQDEALHSKMSFAAIKTSRILNDNERYKNALLQVYR